MWVQAKDDSEGNENEEGIHQSYLGNSEEHSCKGYKKKAAMKGFWVQDA